MNDFLLKGNWTVLETQIPTIVQYHMWVPGVILEKKIMM